MKPNTMPTLSTALSSSAGPAPIGSVRATNIDAISAYAALAQYERFANLATRTYERTKDPAQSLAILRGVFDKVFGQANADNANLVREVWHRRGLKDYNRKANVVTARPKATPAQERYAAWHFGRLEALKDVYVLLRSTEESAPQDADTAHAYVVVQLTALRKMGLNHWRKAIAADDCLAGLRTFGRARMVKLVAGGGRSPRFVVYERGRSDLRVTVTT